jgi:hypothetical protein
MASSVRVDSAGAAASEDLVRGSEAAVLLGVSD